MTDQKHTQGTLNFLKAKHLDNVGGQDFAIVDDEGAIIAEVFEIVGESPREFKRRPAFENAKRFVECWNAMDGIQNPLEFRKKYDALLEDAVKRIYDRK